MKMFSRLHVWIVNKLEELDSFYWKHTKAILKCHTCGLKLIPKIEGYGPKACGWEKTKGRYGHWICHYCLSHARWETGEEIEAWRKEVVRLNKRSRSKYAWRKKIK